MSTYFIGGCKNNNIDCILDNIIAPRGGARIIEIPDGDKIPFKVVKKYIIEYIRDGHIHTGCGKYMD